MAQLDSNSAPLEFANSAHPDALTADSMEEALAKDFSNVPVVRYIFSKRQGNEYHVWICVDEPIANSLDWIFDKELAIINEFEEFGFEFNVVPVMGRDARDILTMGANLVFSRQ